MKQQKGILDFEIHIPTIKIPKLELLDLEETAKRLRGEK